MNTGLVDTIDDSEENPSFFTDDTMLPCQFYPHLELITGEHLLYVALIQSALNDLRSPSCPKKAKQNARRWLEVDCGCVTLSDCLITLGLDPMWFRKELEPLLNGKRKLSRRIKT